ncbi:MAG: right-handed parallel beta-helix repeat-containing protein [Verrucomicrobiales bacterium]|nr:right-handed parallel beta-helix repeat-containing protein [Verrucomicrobiales bacterium]MCP5558887.1 right-handed parallel beta-helix repeat-containing protein [Verrucomicrobiaceae bacterium]
MKNTFRQTLSALLLACTLALPAGLQAANFTVTNTTDSGTGSLRQAIIDAVALAGPDTVTFAPALNGKTIQFASHISITDTSGVFIDASSLSKGITLDGGGTNRLFSVNFNAILGAQCLTFTGGAAPGDSGGAIVNSQGKLELKRCTFVANSAAAGGALYSFTPTGSLTQYTLLEECTLSGNSAATSGGGFQNENGTSTLVHCTITDNTAPAGAGSGVASWGDTLTETIVHNCLIAGNSAGNVDRQGGSTNNSFTSRGGNVIGPGEETGDFNQLGDVINITDPEIGPLAANGGPNQTHALLVGSPAVGRSRESLATNDQRGSEILGMPDTGAYELAPSFLTVTSLNDFGPGTLRQALLDAGAQPNPSVIRFSPRLNGKTILLASVLSYGQGIDVAVDASTLSAGITLDAVSYNFSALEVVGSVSLTLRCLTIQNGVTSGGGAGMSVSGSNVRVQRCSFRDNSAILGATGGAILTSTGSSLTLDHCTLFLNSSTLTGGVDVAGNATINHCTIVGNNGTGLNVKSSAQVRLMNSILAINTGASPDISGTGGLLLSGGHNVIRIQPSGYTAAFQVGAPNAKGDYVGTSGSPVDPRIFVPFDQDNGGPTPTVALNSGSPALDLATTSTSTIDQRGFPIAGAPDAGAYESQAGGTFEFTALGYVVTEGSAIAVPIRRTSGLSGPASVTFTTANGTAKSPADYVGFTQVVDFADGEDIQTVIISTNADADAEPNKVLNMRLSKPSPGSRLGTRSTATVTILDNLSNNPMVDLISPNGTITFPAAGATVGGDFTVTGSATDDIGVSSIFMTGGPLGSAPLPLGFVTPDTPVAPKTKWSIPVSTTTPGPFILNVSVEDTSGHITALPPRTINIIPSAPLGVIVTGSGTVTNGFSPTSIRQVGKPYTLTARPGRGAIFHSWAILTDSSPADFGIPDGALEQPTLTFIHRPGLVLRAIFINNFYTVSGFNGGFTGPIVPNAFLPDRPPAGAGLEDGTRDGLSTTGCGSFRVLSSGAFSGTLKLDGLTLRVAGTFDANGNARFGRGRVLSLSIPRKDNTSLSFSAYILSSTIFGTVTQFDQSGVTAVSDLPAVLNHSAQLPVPADRLAANNGTALYNANITPPTPGLVPLPEGYGFLQLRLSRNGSLRITGVLADGTALTQSTFLTVDSGFSIFAQLYGKKGFFFNHSFIVSHPSDILPAPGKWMRPVLDSQHFPLGWPDPISVTPTGHLYTYGSSNPVKPGLPPIDADGNAQFVVLASGRLSQSYLVGIEDNGRVTAFPTDRTSRFSINRSTGLVSGFFTAPDGTRPAVRGAIDQTLDGPIGFFLSTTPRVKDYQGYSGLFYLNSQ